MKKTKRTARTRSVRHHKKAETAGTTGLVWTLIILVVAGAIGWYAYKQTGGTSGARADVAPGELSDVTIVENNSVLAVGSKSTFAARAWSGSEELTQLVSYSWKVAAGTVRATLTQNGRYVSVVPTAVDTAAPDGTGYLTIAVTATKSGVTRIASQTLTVNPTRTIARAQITPVLNFLMAGKNKVVTANAADTSGVLFDSAVQNNPVATYDWLLINNTAEGRITASNGSVSGNGRTARGQRVTVEAVKAGAGGGYFSVIMTATYNGQKRYDATLVWVEPEQELGSISASPKIANGVSGRIVKLAADAFSTGNRKMRTGISWNWSGASMAGAKFELVKSYTDGTGTSWAEVKVTLPAGSKTVSIPIKITAKQGSISKTDSAVLIVRP